jgi:hypothetical protein
MNAFCAAMGMCFLILGALDVIAAIAGQGVLRLWAVIAFIFSILLSSICELLIEKDAR